jgi:hypothetical protein
MESPILRRPSELSNTAHLDIRLPVAMIGELSMPHTSR